MIMNVKHPTSTRRVEEDWRAREARCTSTYITKDATPSQLPNCPTYISSSIQKRESPETRKTRIEENALEKAISESILDDECHRKTRSFGSVTELKGKLGFLDTSY